MIEKPEFSLGLVRPILEERRADGPARGVCRLIDEMGYATLFEMPPGNGRRPGAIFPGLRCPKALGWWWWDRYGAEMARPAPPQTITAHRRGKLTLRFAWISAGRWKFLFAEESSPR